MQELFQTTFFLLDSVEFLIFVKVFSVRKSFFPPVECLDKQKTARSLSICPHTQTKTSGPK